MNPEYNQLERSAQEYTIDTEKAESKDEGISEPIIETKASTPEEERSIESQANYAGFWDDALQDRLKNDEIKRQFVLSRMHYAKTMPDRDLNDPLQKHKKTSDYYISQVANYDTNLANAFSQVEYVPASDKNKEAKHLGTSNYGEFATLFQDADSKGKGLTERQKNIILAHELGHSIRDYESDDGLEIRKALNLSAVENPQTRNYLNKPEEIIERMSQLKNYFGMKGAEKFTKEHLQYAKKNYVKDTELDNNMTEFFYAVTPETEDVFIDVINRFGV